MCDARGFQQHRGAPIDAAFDLQTLADDLCEVQRICKQFFAALDETRWDRPVQGGSGEWTLHETIAHLCALNGDGLAAVKQALQGQVYVFRGLDDRYQFNAFNRRGIAEHQGLRRQELCAEVVGILAEAAGIARSLQPGQAEIGMQLPIYNRPVTIVEALSIIMIHTGVFHSAQVAEPAARPPLWTCLSPDIRHRAIGRAMRALSLLYRFDIGGPLRTTFAFRVDGPGGGEWFVSVAPGTTTSGEGEVEHPGLAIYLRATDVFCRMFTGRLKLAWDLLRGEIKLRGDLRLFRRMSSLFSVDVRP
jgi:hypothetical protein